MAAEVNRDDCVKQNNPVTVEKDCFSNIVLNI